MDKKEIWAQALVKLQSEVGTISYDLWIKSLEPIDFKNNIFIYRLRVRRLNKG